MNFNYHIHNSSIKCPYCDKDCEDYGYIIAQDLETRIEFECEHCGKKFWVKSCLVYSTYSDCELNDELHDYEQSTSYPAVFDCKNCYHHEVRHSQKGGNNDISRII